MELPEDFAARLVAWQRIHGRHDLPWQRTREPYRVWLSEIMLQQTQVSTVLAYYPRFLQRFPDVRSLAAASLDEVLAAWAGLGYYSRARNLHRCAQVVLEQHGGEFPRSAAALVELPGIGRSTAAAIAAFCGDERAAILDGNVKRVLSRLLAFGEDLAQARNEKTLWACAEALLPAAAGDMPAYTQGLMDLGATICLARKPACALCPTQGLCAAQREGRPEAYPVKT
ncbi:MAG TPA: A/G-specific adenine glycosylase, partial [Methylibium sp.]